MKRIWVSLVAAALLTVAAIAPAAGQDTVTIDMQEVDDSGQSGTANITSDGDQVVVSIEIEPGPDGEPQPAHIHEGTCQDLGDVAYPLEDVVDGVSESTADVSIADIIASDYAIAVHLSEDEMEVIVACGTTPQIGGAPADDDEADDAVEDDDAAEEDDDAAMDDDDDAVTDDEDDAVTDDQDDAMVDDEDDAVADDDDDMVEEDDDAAVEDDDAADDTEDLVPATGGAGMGAESAVILMTVLSGAALGGGLLVRRRFAQV
ncbi:MAG: hypothetical protein EA415_03855 [Sphaerobacteraceae bacterium]|nr:MAG: hypothetical protein EA415_03855 [Sphaerobacteraceae bacterium]